MGKVEIGEVDRHYLKEHHEPITSKELFDRVQEKGHILMEKEIIKVVKIM